MTSANTSLVLQDKVHVDFSHYLDELRRIQPHQNRRTSRTTNSYPSILDILGQSGVSSPVEAYMKRHVLKKYRKCNEKRYAEEMQQYQGTTAAKTVFHAIAHEQSVYEVDVHPLGLARLMALNNKGPTWNRRKRTNT